MSKRFFAFGCSYTKYSYATWADYIGVNFDEYYNYGRGGASNTYIMNKFVEANTVCNFTSDDYIIVMLTGIGRFSFAPTSSDRSLEWNTAGDLYENYTYTKNPIFKSFVENMYCEDWVVYSAWVAVKTIKTILTAKNIPHKIMMAIDNSNYLHEDGSKWGREDKIKLTHLTQEIYDVLDVKETLDEWMKRKQFSKFDYVCWKNEGNRIDGHPTQKMHYDFLIEKFPEFITEKSVAFFNKAEEIFDSSTQNAQGANFVNSLQFAHDKAFNNNLI